MAPATPHTEPEPSGVPSLRLRLEGPEHLHSAAAWAFEAICARAGVRSWVIVDHESADLVWSQEGEGALPCRPEAWEFRLDAPPQAAVDPLAFTFWWLARVEEQLAPESAFDEHGRFRFEASALSRLADPLSAPVDELAASLAEGPLSGWRSARGSEPRWRLVLTHDIDLPWRWTRAGTRRALRSVRQDLRSLRVGHALRTALALAASVLHRARGTDPWNNAGRINAMEVEVGARSTSYVLADRSVPQDGEPTLLELGGDYLRELRSLDDLDGSTRIGIHGSYRSSVAPGVLAHERDRLEGQAHHRVVDHRFHYLRHRPHTAWPLLARAGVLSDASLGFAERPGFRAGTANPFRAWDHEARRPLDLVVIPLACMDASFDERYLDVRRHAERTAHVDAVIAAIAGYGGSASLLVHNDRLCNLADDGWTRQYRGILRRLAEAGGEGCTARAAALAYLALLPSQQGTGPPPQGR